MSSTYDQLLDATIQHLEDLKSRGVRHVAVATETLRALAQPLAGKPQTVNSKSAASGAPSTASARREFPAQAGTVPGAPPIQSALRTPHSLPRQSEAATGAIPSPVTEQASLLSLPGETVPSQTPPLDPQAKATAFAALRERALACVKCPHLASSRKTVVFGVGSIDAQLMFVGEAPGADEDEQGEPFVGKAGQLLTKIIQATGLQRADVYIGNILKCRPDTPGQSAGNRKPTTDEMATCIPYLHEQIDLIRPRVLVALGATAVEGLLGKTIGITKLRGTWRTYRGIPLMPTYHPAYLLRNQAMSEKRKVWEDMLAVMEKLGLPISEKQRNYFLRS
ncbi:MAG TPA: uracil-DNA glycosylase family protein [Verrucomicrobiae bacterium]|nr:uracil-DNA glycosylase family protein [Verrucomicrobiae bacterium]